MSIHIVILFMGILKPADTSNRFTLNKYFCVLEQHSVKDLTLNFETAFLSYFFRLIPTFSFFDHLNSFLAFHVLFEINTSSGIDD